MPPGGQLLMQRRRDPDAPVLAPVHVDQEGRLQARLQGEERLDRLRLSLPTFASVLACVVVAACAMTACRDKPAPGGKCRVPDQLVCGAPAHALLREASDPG